MNKKNSKIIIAGANGFIGSFLSKKLKSNYDVTSLGCSKNSFEKNYVALDLTDKEKVSKFVENAPLFDVLIFLVGLAHKKGRGKEIGSFRQINKQTLMNLTLGLDKKDRLPAKIIFASTISVYGEKINQKFYYEDSNTEPFSPYAITKLEAEEFLLKHYSAQSWILRFAPVYSSNFQLNINRRSKVKDWYYKIGDGTNRFSLCSVVNIGVVVQGILDNIIPPGLFNISDRKNYTYIDLLNYMNADWIIKIPMSAIKVLHYVGKMMNIVFLNENSIKLISDNLYPCDKITKYIELPAELNDSKSVKQII